MRRKHPARLLLLLALAVTAGGVTLSTPASGAPVIFDQNANKAVNALIRPDLIRAEIVTFNSGGVGDYMVDRGVVRKLRGRLLTLVERDGTTVQVRLSPATEIRIDGRKSAQGGVRIEMRATVMREGNTAASWLYIAKRLPDKSGPKIKSLLSSDFVRAEMISWVGGTLLDRRADTGVIESADATSLALLESDGTTVPMQIEAAAQVLVNNRVADAAGLVAGMKATTIGSGDGTVGQIWATGKSNVRKK